MRLRTTLAVLVAASLAGTACAGGDADGNDGTSDPGANGDASGPVYGGTATYGLEAENSGGWCLPEGQLAISGIQVARAIYDTLTVPDADAEYVPFLAESVEPNEDFSQWTITLRDGVTFHDGTELDAGVVKNNLDAYRGEYPARQPLLLRFIFEPVTAVDVVDDLTLTVTTDAPWPAFPAALYANGRAGIIGQAQLDDPDTCDRKLIGTGPFQLDEWVVNDHLSASRNQSYWGTDADGNQLPYLDAIEFRPVVDPVTKANAVLSGDLTMAHGSGGAVTQIWMDADDAGDISLVSSEEFPEVAYTIVNAAKPPFDNRNARLAAAAAVDVEEFNQIRNNGIFTIASGPFGPGNMGYLEDAGYPPYDLEAARGYAAAYEAETGQPLAFSYTYQSDPETTQTAQVLQSMWQEAGFDVSIRPIEQAALISTAIGGDYDTISWRNHPGGDPDSQYIWWYGGSPLNFGGFDDPELNALLDEGRTSLDPERRTEVYEEVNRQFGAEAYNQWINWVRWSVAGDTGVNGVFGPLLPDGSEPFGGLAGGHPVSGIWLAQ